MIITKISSQQNGSSLISLEFKMIVVEDKLKAIFNFIPEMSYTAGSTLYKPVFGFGNKLELVAFIKQAETNEFNTYPLIWLLYPFNEKHKNWGRKVEIEDLTLILAVNASKTMLNDERLETTFKRVLIPLYENIETLFKRASTLNVSSEVGVVKFPNYSGDLSDGDSNFTVDRWDALKTIWNVTINDFCLKDIII